MQMQVDLPILLEKGKSTEESTVSNKPGHWITLFS